VEAEQGDLGVFDGHVHLGTWKTPDFLGHGMPARKTAEVLRRAGIREALVMPTDSGDNEGTLRAIREEGEPGWRFAAWVDPGNPDLPGFLQREEASIAALKFHPSFHRTPLRDPSFRPFLEWAAERGVPCVVHCGRWQEVAGWPIALEVAESLPGLPMVLAHMGGDSPGLVAGVVEALRQRDLPRVSLGTESIREPWLIAHAVRRLGASRLVFGSDHNLNEPRSFLAVIEALDLADEDRRAILQGNARRWFTREVRRP